MGAQARQPAFHLFSPSTWIAAVARLASHPVAGGLVLLLAAAVALLWANSRWAGSYEALWHLPLSVGLGDVHFTQSLHFWVNDGLMTVFFLMVGMEIRHELHAGALAEPRQALLPVLAALGGVAMPALFYLGWMLLGSADGAGELQRGWAVPTATDIAFALGVLALLGRGLPVALRVFLLTLAIIDDLVAILIIALFYSDGLQWSALWLALAGVVLVIVQQKLGLRRAWAFVPAGALVWWGLWQGGFHPTLAGVLLGLMTPVRALPHEAEPPVARVAHQLQPWVGFAIMPLFALANAGVSLQSGGEAAGAQLVMAAVAAALVLGKPLGVLAVCWLALRLGWCRLPDGLNWGHMLLAGLLAGIGFTMAIFIATLAFADAGLLSGAKLGVLMGSAVAAVLGLGWGWCLHRQRVRTASRTAI